MANMDYKITKARKQELTQQAFYLFQTLGKQKYDVLRFQQLFRKRNFPNRMTPVSQDQKRRQNYEDQTLNRIVQKQLIETYPRLTIEQEASGRSFIREKTENYQIALERKLTSELLNSDPIRLGKKNGMSVKHLETNINANLHVMPYPHATKPVTDKSIHKWKEGIIRIPPDYSCLTLMSIFKWLEANKNKYNRGRPKKETEGISNHELAEFLGNANMLMDLGEFKPFNSSVITICFTIMKWFTDVKEALDSGLNVDETTEAIWNLYDSVVRVNYSKNDNNYFTKKDLRNDIQILEVANKRIKALMEGYGYTSFKSEDLLKFTNEISKTLGINQEATKDRNNEMYGEITNDHLDQVDEVMKIYIDLYKKFRYVDQSRPYVQTPGAKEDKEYFEDDEMKINQEEYKDPEDYYGV
jgi:hypothetical protein